MCPVHYYSLPLLLLLSLPNLGKESVHSLRQISTSDRVSFSQGEESRTNMDREPHSCKWGEFPENEKTHWVMGLAGLTMRMSNTSEPFGELSISPELTWLVFPFTENPLRPIGKIYTLKWDDNNLFWLSLNFDEYNKENSELIRRPSAFWIIETIRLTTSDFFSGLFIIWFHVRANGPIRPYMSLWIRPGVDEKWAAFSLHRPTFHRKKLCDSLNATWE